MVVSVSCQEEMEAVLIMQARGELAGPLFFAGKGSNVLFPDKGVDGTLVRFESADLSAACRWGEDGQVSVEAGCPLQALSREAAKRGVGGFEFLSGIPGTVGGAAVMNAGAGGKDWASLCKTVTIMTQSGEIRTVPKPVMHYGYRTSILSNRPENPSTKMERPSGDLTGAIVLGAVLVGQPDSPERCKDNLLRHLDYRKKTQPLDDPSLGSVFRNPEGVPPGFTAGRLIEEAGLKGEARGGVMVSPRHANFFVNTGAGRAADFKELLDFVIIRVKERWGIVLEPEVRVWNG